MSKQIAKILKNRQPEGYTTQQMYDCLKQIHGENVNEHSVKRAMSTMTGTKNAPKKYQDKYGRWPLIKLDEKRYNPKTDKHIHVYAWNPRYGEPKTHREILKKYQGQQQMDFHPELKQQEDG